MLCMLVPAAGLAAETVEQKITAGIVEPIAVGSHGIVVDAKIDTGADSCSLDAKNIQEFEKDGARWVRFDVTGRDGQSDALQRSLDDNASVDDTLEAIDDHPFWANLEQFSNQDQAFSRKHDASKADIFQSAESDHLGFEQIVFLNIVAAHLSRRFQHHDSRHKRHSRHVATHPKFAVRNILIANANVCLWVVIDDGGELFHFVALRIVLANLV